MYQPWGMSPPSQPVVWVPVSQQPPNTDDWRSREKYYKERRKELKKELRALEEEKKKGEGDKKKTDEKKPKMSSFALGLLFFATLPITMGIYTLIVIGSIKLMMWAPTLLR